MQQCSVQWLRNIFFGSDIHNIYIVAENQVLFKFQAKGIFFLNFVISLAMRRSISITDAPSSKSSSSGLLGSRTKSSLTNMSYLKKPAQNKSRTDRAVPVNMSESVYSKISSAARLGSRSKSGVANMSFLNRPPKSPAIFGEMATDTRPPAFDRKTRKSITTENSQLLLKMAFWKPLWYCLVFKSIWIRNLLI